MSTSDELAASLAEAEGQLAAVEAGLSVDSTSQVPFHLHLANGLLLIKYVFMLCTLNVALPSCQDLLDLKQQLCTLIELTKEGLLEQRRAELLQEVGQLEAGDSSGGVGEAGSRKEELETSLEEDFSQLVGLRVSAPLSTLPPIEWGNAVVVGVEQCAGDFGDVMVRLAFSNPTRMGLVPCQHYLDGRCSRGAQCRWSHGELAKLGSLRQWREPQYSLIKPGAEVLMKGDDGVWERAMVVEELMGEFMVTPSKVAAEPLCKTAEDLLPLLTAVDDDPEEDSDNDDDKLETSVDAEDEEDNFSPLELCVNVSNERLGKMFTKVVF